ncbi:MAG: DUF2848 domain-containing protein [Alphaproteobacteria bacterium]|nr:DUF2848 domain-containing protein [Alphaproteobacteria bacterium]
MKSLSFQLISDDTPHPQEITIDRTIVAGWTARNVAAMEKHIAELEELGVTRPVRTPMFYRVSCSCLTLADEIEVIGHASSGEVEFVLVNFDGDIWLGTGSDHTDREAEAVGVTLSKQMCDKPLAGALWRLSDVADHWDELQLKASAVIDGERVPYQEGQVSAMLAPETLLELYAAEDQAKGGFSPGDVMFCGTLPAIGGVRPGARFEFELVDPVLNRRLTHGYAVVELPIEG